MADFPRSLIAFQRRFPDERACAAYLAQARRRGGFRCPACGPAKGWERSTRRFTWECACCGRQTSVTACSLHAFIKANLTPGATARTDGWSGYAGASAIAHDAHVTGPMAAHIVLPWTHRVFANLKTWALGVYHGLRQQHLQSYLDAFTFRFNRRRTRHAAFRSLLAIAAAKTPATYNILIKPEATA